MKIPYTLTPRSERASATALLLPSSRADDLFDLVARLGLEAFPSVYATADGFLFKLPEPLKTPLAGVIHLRNLAGNLLVPVDADLVPSLLLDEAEGLVRSRGLVVLPGPRVLEFTPDRPLTWDKLLDLPRIHAPQWHALPEAPALADELLEVTSTAEPPPADDILEQGRSDIGTESPRPEDSAGMGKKLAGGAAYAAGKSLAWLGTKLGLSGLAGAGANLLQRAMDLAPRLSERLMGEQEATLRNLLKDFREGKIDEALRRALPLDPTGSRPIMPAGNAKLPRHNLFYSLQNLLGGRQGPGSMWFTPGDLYYLLQAEYRKQAENAAAHGDFRRAAFIYAKLLNDLGTAARLLSQGGLHRDAAVIYEQALHNLRAAATEWEAAGEIDKALELFIQIGDDLAAAELLRKVGEAERALIHYRRAAAKLASQKKHFGAGEMFRTRAQRLDLALEMYREGWQTRPQVSALPCGLFLADHYAQEPNPPRFLQLLDDGEACLRELSADSTVHFFNHLARLSKLPVLSEVAATTQDRCLLALADKMTQPDRAVSGARAGSLFFPADTPWAAPVVRDAQFALSQRTRSPAGGGAPWPVVRLGNSTVRAVCHMPLSGDLFLGFEDGEVLQLRIPTGNIATLTKQPGPILGLLAGAEEHHLIALSQSGDMANLLTASRSVHFRFQGLLSMRTAGRTSLCAIVENQTTPFFGILAGDRCHIHRCDNPSWHRSFPTVPGDGPRSAIVGALPHSPDTPWCLLFLGERAVFVIDSKVVLTFDVEAAPENPVRNTLHEAPLQGWVEDEDTLVVHWVTTDSSLYCVRIFFLDPQVTQSPLPTKVQTENPVRGVHGSMNRRSGTNVISNLWDSLRDPWVDRGYLFNPVAAFSLPTGEILMVEANGVLTRVPRRLG